MLYQSHIDTNRTDSTRLLVLFVNEYCGLFCSVRPFGRGSLGHTVPGASITTIIIKQFSAFRIHKRCVGSAQPKLRGAIVDGIFVHVVVPYGRMYLGRGGGGSSSP